MSITSCRNSFGVTADFVTESVVTCINPVGPPAGDTNRTHRQQELEPTQLSQ
jgi:hypothetical protein